MAKTKQASRTAETRELEKTLLLDGQQYNINAVHATQVDNKLTLNKVNIDGVTNSSEFNGAANVELSVVPAAGGAFSGPIRAKSATNVKDNSGHIKDDAVLNYGDFNNVILKSLINNSILYEWKYDAEASENKLIPAIDSGNTISGISLITGTEHALINGTNGFAKENENKNYLPAYLYICTDTNNIYFGTSTSSTATRLAASAANLVDYDLGLNYNAENIKQLENTLEATANYLETLSSNITDGTIVAKQAEQADQADQATKLNTPRQLKVDLASNTGVYFDGTDNATTIGVYNVLPVERGGTGTISEAGVRSKFITGQMITPQQITIIPNASTKGWQVNPNDATAPADCGVNLQGSDLIGLNGLFFHDVVDNVGEGINFPRENSNNVDRLYAYNGVLYFAPNSTIDPTSKNSKWGNYKKVYHQGNITMSKNPPTISDGEVGDIWIVYK